MRSIDASIDDSNCYAGAIRCLLRLIGMGQRDAARQVRRRQRVFGDIRHQRVICQAVERTPWRFHNHDRQCVQAGDLARACGNGGWRKLFLHLRNCIRRHQTIPVCRRRRAQDDDDPHTIP
jgi:hypothetical protein